LKKIQPSVSLIGWAVTATTVSPTYALGVLAATWWVSIAPVAAFTHTDRRAPLVFLPYIIDLSVTLYINYRTALL
jgi:tryptophan-rich sensory protein